MSAWVTVVGARPDEVPAKIAQAADRVAAPMGAGPVFEARLARWDSVVLEYRPPARDGDTASWMLRAERDSANLAYTSLWALWVGHPHRGHGGDSWRFVEGRHASLGSDRKLHTLEDLRIWGGI